MDQAKFESLLADFQQYCTSENMILDLEAHPGSSTAPLVLLVHGIGGSALHWSDPVSLNVTDTWLFDLNSRPASSFRGLGMSAPYKPENVTSWTKFLGHNGLTYINFSQTRPSDLLQYTVEEVVFLLETLEQRVFQPLNETGDPVPPLIILCHSRGGLAVRAALKQLGSAKVPHLRKVITLCTPHQGTYMPRLANDYNKFLYKQLDFVSLAQSLPRPVRLLFRPTLLAGMTDLSNRVRQALLHTFGTLAESPGFDELVPQSATMQALAENDQPLPGVQYYSFGGSNSTFVNFFFCVAGQSIHIMSTASALLIGMLTRIPGVQGMYGGLAELVQGDSAVSLSSSRWPEAFEAPHQDFHLNHMQALVDAPLQQAVLEIIKS